MIETEEIDDLRVEILETLVSTCSIERPTNTNVKGKVTETWAAVASNVACRLDPQSRRSQDNMIAEQERGRSYFQLTLPWNANVRDGDRIDVGGAQYDILQLHNTHSARIVTRALLVKVG